MQSTAQALKKKALSAAVSFAVLGTASSLAQAQADQDSGVLMVEEIVVTATRREQSIQDIPYNISAIDGELLDRAQISDSAELLRAIPGVGVVDRGHRNAGVINGVMIRGLNVDGSAFGDYALSTVPTVSTYVNDTPIYANFQLSDIERVEVLRGPQGTLYGSGSLGGTVRYITRQPQFDGFSATTRGRTSATDGSDGLNWSADAVLNIPFSQTLALRVVGGHTHYAGVVDYPNVYVLDENRLPLAPAGPLESDAVFQSVEDADEADIDHLRAALRYEPNDRFSALLSYHYQEDDVGGRRHQTQGLDGFGQPYDEHENGSVILEPSSRDVNLTSLEMEVDLGFATLTSSTSGYEHEGDSISENTGFYAQNNWLAAFYYNYPRPMAEAQRTYADEAFIQEVRLVSDGDGDFDWIVGAFYRDQDLVSTQHSFLRGFQRWADTAWGPGFVVNDNDFAYRRDENFQEKALFGEITWHASERLRLTAGLRSFDTDFTNHTDMGVGLYTSFSVQDEADFANSEDDTLFKFNLGYDLSEEKMLYATVSEGYRRGGANAVPLSGTFAEDPAWQLYESDTVTNYEIGVKGRAGQAYFNVALFAVDWDNVQINTATTNWGFFAAQNGGSASTSGLEVELNGNLSRNWHYSLGYAYVDAELDDDVYAPSDPARTTPVALAGATLPGTSEHTLNVAFDHNRELGNGMIWSNRINAYYQSETENAINRSARFNQELDSFSLWNLTSTISRDNWTVSLYLRNAFNEEGVTGLFKEQYMGTAPEQNYFGNGSKEFLALPRTLGVSFSYEF